MVGRDKSKGHGEEQAGSNQAWGCWRWNIEEPASGADDQSQEQSNYSCDHSSTLLERETVTAETPPTMTMRLMRLTTGDLCW